MANPVTKTVTKTVKKTTKKAARKVLKGSVAYAKGCIARAAACWAIAALIAALPSLGINLPSAFTGQDTVTVLAFLAVGVLMFGRGVSIPRLIQLVRTFMQ